MKNILLVAALLLFISGAHPLSAQNKNCNLTPADLISMVKADGKTVDGIVLHHCFVVDKSASNGALANYKRDYQENNKPCYDHLFTVASGVITLITSSEATYNLLLSGLKKMGFKYSGKDNGCEMYKYRHYTMCIGASPGPHGGTDHGFMIDKE